MQSYPSLRRMLRFLAKIKSSVGLQKFIPYTSHSSFITPDVVNGCLDVLRLSNIENIGPRFGWDHFYKTNMLQKGFE